MRTFVSNIVRAKSDPQFPAAPVALPVQNWDGIFNARSRSAARGRFASAGRTKTVASIVRNPSSGAAGDGATDDGYPLRDNDNDGYENSAYPGHDDVDQNDDGPDEVTEDASESRQPGITRRDGVDYGSDGHNADGRNPGDPVAPPPLGKVDTSGMGKTSSGGLPKQTPSLTPPPLLKPTMKFGTARRESGQDVNHDYPKRSPSDLLADKFDNSPEGNASDRQPIVAFGQNLKQQIAKKIQGK